MLLITPRKVGVMSECLDEIIECNHRKQNVTASYIVLSGAPNLHLLSFHLFTLRLRDHM